MRVSSGRQLRTLGVVAMAVAAAVAVAGTTLAGVLPSSAPQAAAHGFLTRSGKQLLLDGQPYKFVGVNAFGLTGCDGSSTDATEAGLDRYFASLRPLSVTRTWAFEPWGVDAVDRVVRAAERHNQMVILALADGANYCDDDGHDAAFYAGGYRGSYLDWVRTVVPRYRDSTAIAAWEIMNEPKGASSDPVMKAFFDETAALIKSLAPNHLVSTGAQAEYVDGTRDYAYVHSGPNIDLGSLHEYDYHTSNGEIVSNHFAPTIAAMNSINKPMYIGESGVTAADGGCLTRQARVDVFRRKFDGYLNAGAVGVLPWNYRTTKVDSCDYYGPGTIYPGDPLMPFIRSYDIPGITDPTNPPSSPPVSPSARTTQVNDAQFTYTGSWNTATGAGKFQGDDHYSSATGATYSLSFAGSRVSLYVSVAPHHGIAAVSVDGGPETTVDLYSANRAEQRLIYTSPVLASGAHVIRVRVTGTRNSASSGTVVNADRIDTVAP
jgi:mannan endo-1,4-beta-mannosidase